MSAWFSKLQPSERRTLVIGGLLLAVILFYFLAWEPLARDKARLERRLAEQRAALAWMERAAAEIRMLRKGTPDATRPQGSLLSVVDRTARDSGLGHAIRRVQPQGAESVRVWLERVAFDELILWLGGLRRRHNLRLSEISVTKRDRPGLVNVRLTLTTG